MYLCPTVLLIQKKPFIETGRYVELYNHSNKCLCSVSVSQGRVNFSLPPRHSDFTNEADLSRSVLLNKHVNIKPT